MDKGKGYVLLLINAGVRSSVWCGGVILKVFNATFNNISAISWQPVLLVVETGVSR